MLVIHFKYSTVYMSIPLLPPKKSVTLTVVLLAAPWTVDRQALLSIEISRQEYWSGEPFPFPVGLPDPGIEPRSPTFQADSLLS